MPAFLINGMQAFFCSISVHLNKQEDLFMVQVGDHLPQGQLVEFTEASDGKLASRLFDISESVKGKQIVILALPKAFSRQVSQRIEAARSQDADEIWCLGGQDPAVMALWCRELKSAGGVRLVTDGSGVYSQALGLSAEYAAAGNAASRSSLRVEDGIVKQLNVDAPGTAEASNDERVLAQAA